MQNCNATLQFEIAKKIALKNLNGKIAMQNMTLKSNNQSHCEMFYLLSKGYEILDRQSKVQIVNTTKCSVFLS